MSRKELENVARVAPADPKRLPLWLRAYFSLQQRLRGRVLEPSRIWARAPIPMRAFLQLVAAVDRRSSPIEPALRSLVQVKVSQLNACSFCVDLNGSILQRRGVPLDKALALHEHESSPLFSPRERAVLDYAAAVTTTGAQVSDEVFAALRSFLDDDAIVELTALIALQDASSKFNTALAIASAGLCPALALGTNRHSDQRGDAAKAAWMRPTCE